MRVDDESVHSHVYQMIERESNERLLKNRDERLRQLVGQWTQARATTCCQNECLINFVHEQKIERFLPPTLKLRRGRRLHSQWVQTGYVRLLSQVKRPRAEVDDAMVPSQCFCTEQPGDRRRSFQQSVVNESFQIYHTHIFAHDIDRADGQLANVRHTHAALFQIHGRGAIWRLASGNSHLSDERTVQ